MDASHPEIEKILISTAQISERVKALGEEVSQFYSKAVSEGQKVVVIIVMKGSFVFGADLCRHMPFDHIVDFIQISSYEGTNTTGQVKLVMDLKTDISGKHILIVEDIVDTGHTLGYLRKLLLARQPLSMKLVSFLDKPSRRLEPVQVDFVGFEIPNEFVVGYGLDWNERLRGLPYVGILKRSLYAP